jgi:hypothetical protein
LDKTIHRIALRFGDQDTIFRPRGLWTKEITDHLLDLGQVAGAKLDCPLLPQVWERPEA